VANVMRVVFLFFNSQNSRVPGRWYNREFGTACKTFGDRGRSLLPLW